jgi:hypothetical protein
MKKMGRIVAIVFATAVFVSAFPVTSVKAVTGDIWTTSLDGADFLGGIDPYATLEGNVDNTASTTSTTSTTKPVWVGSSDGWSYLQGTDIRAQQNGEILTIKGTGALPDYDYWTLGNRPWNNSTCSYLMIDSSITYIGSYDFYGLENIKYISMGSGTFINDGTCFEKIAYMPTFRIYGSEETTKNFGTISVSSMDTIKRMGQTNWNGACFILDTYKLAKAFQNSTNPTITNVYDAQDTSAPWSDVNENGNGGVATSICKISTPGVSVLYDVSAQLKYPGNACYEAYAAFIGDYNFATTFNITLNYGGEKVVKTDTEMSYTLTIPSEFRAPGRTFKLLAIAPGTVYTYDDLDTAYDTITFTTKIPTTSYALIYKD